MLVRHLWDLGGQKINATNTNYQAHLEISSDHEADYYLFIPNPLICLWGGSGYVVVFGVKSCLL